MEGPRVGSVPFEGICQDAAALLNLAWDAPALHYTPEYLRWQAGFPVVAGAGALAVAARVGKRLVGFAGATPRRMKLGSAVVPILVVSFVAVDPEYRGLGLAAALYAVLIEQIRRSPALGILTFAELGSRGLSVLEAAYRVAGLAGIDLGAYPTYARTTSAGREAARDVRPADTETPPVVANPPGLLTECPDADGWQHHLRDPRPFLAMQTPDGGATAIFAEGHRRARTTIEPFGILTSLYVSAERSDALRDFGEAAAAWLGSRAGILVAPNLVPLSESSARGAAFRKLAGPNYTARLYPLGPGSSVLRGTARTSLTVT